MRFPDIVAVMRETPFAVVGAAATRLYMPERATNDLDIVVRPGEAPAARRRLAEAECAYLGELSIGGSSWRTADGFPVDVLEPADPWVGEAVDEARTNRDAHGLPIMPLAYLVVMKLQAGRSQDVADVARMLGQADDESLAAVRRVVRAHLPDAADDVESLIALGRLELE